MLSVMTVMYRKHRSMSYHYFHLRLVRPGHHYPIICHDGTKYQTQDNMGSWHYRCNHVVCDNSPPWQTLGQVTNLGWCDQIIVACSRHLDNEDSIKKGGQEKTAGDGITIMLYVTTLLCGNIGQKWFLDHLSKHNSVVWFKNIGESNNPDVATSSTAGHYHSLHY